MGRRLLLAGLLACVNASVLVAADAQTPPPSGTGTGSPSGTSEEPSASCTGRRVSSQVGRFVPGDAVFGGKVRLLEQRAGRPALAVSAELKVPLTRTLAKLQTGSGTGGFDQTARITAEWKGRHPSLVVSAGFTHVGGAPFGDRLIVFHPQGDVEVTESPLRLPNRVSLGLGYRHTLRSWAALIAEATK